MNEGNHFSFATKNRDNGFNCAQSEHGAWWYAACGYSNLNGPYVAGFNGNVTSVHWYYWKNSFYSLKKVNMMIKRIRKIERLKLYDDMYRNSKETKNLICTASTILLLK